MKFSDYQQAVPDTAKLDPSTKDGRIELVLGLLAEVGSLAKAYKRHLRDGVPLESQRETLKQDIGDVQWYVAMIAHSLGLNLSEIASENLVRTQDRYGAASKPSGRWTPPFEDGYPEVDKFPRRMVFRITEPAKQHAEDLPHVHFEVVDAQPYVFGDIPRNRGTKQVGFDLGDGLGDDVNDNSRRPDGYRYHDAVHVAFMAVLNWSPVMRALLHVKRRSNEDIDRNEDGARARDLEEALSAILMEYSKDRNNFQRESDIDGETRDLMHRVIGNLEVKAAPIWLWAKAIHQGYVAMQALMKHKQGWLVADLDAQTVVFSAEEPKL